MYARIRNAWSHHIDQIIRSRHYTWLGLGLGGEPVEDALVTLTADIMHICKRRGISFEELIEQSRAKFEQEEQETTV
jgi:hypothetical protein